MRTHLKRKHPDIFYAMVEQDRSRKALSKELAANCKEAFKARRQKKQQPAAKRKKVPEEMVTMAEATRAEMKTMICDAWKSKKFSDVDVLCGVDGGVVKTHRIFLSGLSPFLRKVLLSVSFVASEDSFLHLPEVDSRALSGFLDKVCSGYDGFAAVDPSLEFLGFGAKYSPNEQGFSEGRTEPETLLYEPADENEDDSYAYGDFEDLVDDEPVIKQPLDEDDDVDDDPDFVEEKKKPRTRKRRRRSMSWKFFNRVSSLIATCKFCAAEIRTENGTTSGMLTHLRTMHTDVYVSDVAPKDLSAFDDSFDAADPSYEGEDQKESADDTEGESSKSKNNRRKKRSQIWNFFTAINANEARCLTCGGCVKGCGGSTSAMIRHLKVRHPEFYDQLEQSRSAEDLVKGRVRVRVPKQTDDSSAAERKSKMAELTFRSSPAWKIFKSDKEDDPKVACSLCHKQVRRPRHSSIPLLRHIRDSHEEAFNVIREQLENPSFPETFDSANPIWEFYNIVDLKSARCHTCLAVFDVEEHSVENLSQHLGSDHPDSLVSYSAFVLEWRRRRHEEFAVYKRSRNPTDNDNRVWNYFEKTGNDNEALCKTCRVVVLFDHPNVGELSLHLDHEHPDLSEELQKDGPKPLTESEDISDRTCSDCGKEFKSQKTMLYHRKTVHSGIKPYKCKYCEMTFSRPDGLRSHTHVHDRTQSYLCSHCGKQFARRNQRDRHERGAHFGDKREKCSYCGKMFQERQNRITHERIHTGEKPYQCTHCGRRFTQSDQLRSHTRTHTGEKPYPCNFCGQKFRFISSRNSHKCEGKLRRAAEQQLLEEASIDSE